MRLTDEQAFTAYGPVRYDLAALITWATSHSRHG